MFSNICNEPQTAAGGALVQNAPSQVPEKPWQLVSLLPAVGILYLRYQSSQADASCTACGAGVRF